MKKKHVIVVGIGLNGSCVSNELIKKKFKVTAIDSYGFLKKETLKNNWQKKDFVNIKNSLSIIKSLILNNLSNFKNPVIFRLNSLINDKSNNIISVNKFKFKTYEINKIGGRGHLWGRVSPRYPNVEFTKSNGWLFNYNNIKQYYKEIEKKFELSGNKRLSKTLNHGNIVKEKKFNKIEKKFVELVLKKWKNIKVNVLPTLSYNSGPFNPMLKEIINNENFIVMQNSIVNKIVLDNDGKAAGIELIDRLTLKKKIVYSDFIFLSASPLETIKILLNSKSKKFRNGIGNNMKMLGKKIFDHIGISYSGFINIKKNYGNKKFDPFNPNKKTGGFYFFPFRRQEVRKKESLKFSIHGTIDNIRKIISIYSFADCPQESNNYISIDKKKKDKFGLPILKINFKWSKEQINTWKDQKKVIRELLLTMKHNLKLKIYQSKSNSNIFNKLPNPGFSHHESGGAIMGTSPKQSVVNKLGQIWDCNNIYICDQSVFPKLNYINPTLTSMAISLRTARNFAKKNR